LTTAEKQALLETQGEAWPDCKCHDRPMLWQRDVKLTAGGRFRCRSRIREWQRDVRQRRRDSGVCIYCSGPLTTETMCQGCADSHSEIMAQPKQQMLRQLAGYRHKNRVKADEGFRPSGVGIAAYAAYVSNRGDT
jgi:hypothetical protein